MRTVRDPAQSREILALAVPAFLALVAEPLFLLADSAIIGHLGTAQLAGLGVASATLITAANIFVFLAYGTTSIVARQVGAGSERGALEAGIDGTWLAIGLGAVTAVVVALGAEPLCRLFGASEAAHRVRRDLPAHLRARHPGDARGPRGHRACSAGCRTPGPRWSRRSSGSRRTSC